MGSLNLTHREVNKAIEDKVRPVRRAGKEINCWYCLDGKQLFRVTTPKVHAGTIPTGTLNNIRNSLKLNTPDFVDLVKCHMNGMQYEELIRTKKAEGKL